MSIDHPRRIFKSGRKTGFRPFWVLGGIVALTASVAALDALPNLPGEAASAPGAMVRTISATPDRVAVIDGDTLRLGKQVVRLSDIQAPARGEACAAGPDCGGSATAALASLVEGHEVECRVSSYDRLGRPAGRCDAGGKDMSIALVSTGWAKAETPDLGPAEADARTHRRGIWLAN